MPQAQAMGTAPPAEQQQAALQQRAGELAASNASLQARVAQLEALVADQRLTIARLEAQASQSAAASLHSGGSARILTPELDDGRRPALIVEASAAGSRASPPHGRLSHSAAVGGLASHALVLTPTKADKAAASDEADNGTAGGGGADVGGMGSAGAAATAPAGEGSAASGAAAAGGSGAPRHRPCSSSGGSFWTLHADAILQGGSGEGGDNDQAA